MIKTFRNFMIKRTISAKLRNRAMNTFSNYEIFKTIRAKAEANRERENRHHMLNLRKIVLKLKITRIVFYYLKHLMQLK